MNKQLSLIIFCLFSFVLSFAQPAGSLDPSFGVGGKVVTSIGTGIDKAYGVAIQSDGKIKSVEIYNLHGQKLITTTQKQISISSLSSGIYLVRVEDDKNNTTTKMYTIYSKLNTKQ